MKIFFGLLTLLVGTTVSASELSFWQRSAKEPQKLVKTGCGLHLSRLQTKHFEIRFGEAEEAISENDQEVDMVSGLSTFERGAHVLCHLEYARKFFERHFEDFDFNEKIVVRIGMNKGFDQSFHFDQSNMISVNNALSIPESDSWKLSAVKPWGPEIWFMRAEKEKSRTQTPSISLDTSKQVAKSTALGSLSDYSRQVGNLIKGRRISVTNLTLSYATPYVAQIIAIPLITKAVAYGFPKTIFGDTAMIPEIIYHEYSHQALSRWIQIATSSAVKEGFADIFASMISGLSTLGHQVDKVSNLPGKRAIKAIKYDSNFERQDLSHLNFVYSFLRGLADRFEVDRAADLIWNAAKELDNDSDIISDLPHSLARACNKDQSPGECRQKLQAQMAMQGF